MFIFPGSFRANIKTIRGVQYRVVSFYDGEDLIFDRIGSLIENAYKTTNCIAIDEARRYNKPVIESLRERSSNDNEAG